MQGASPPGISIRYEEEKPRPVILIGRDQELAVKGIKVIAVFVDLTSLSGEYFFSTVLTAWKKDTVILDAMVD